MKFLIKLILVSFSLLITLQCTKFVQVPPPSTEISGTSVYATNSTAAAAVSGIYLTMSNYGQPLGGGMYGISGRLGLSADEFNLYPTGDLLLNQTYTNSIQSRTENYTWNGLYNCIYQANSAIEGITNSIGVTTSIKQQLIGESKFVRALCYFYLVNIYGNIPLILTTNYSTNSQASQTPKNSVYQSIISDLKDAQLNLSDNFLNPDGSISDTRVRPNKGAATALLARTFLYTQNWDSAENEATLVIDNPNYRIVYNLDSVFLANSNEAIWQIEVPDNGSNTPDASSFLLSYYGGPNSNPAPFILSDSLAYSFEIGDHRFQSWIDSIVVPPNTYYFPYKYKLAYTGNSPQEYTMVLRLAEQYLIRSEARAQQNNIIGAQSDLNVIRQRAGVSPTSALSQQELLLAILQERKFELFTEFGHRWLDLERTGNLNATMENVTSLKGGIWKPTASLFPIPLSEIQFDNKLNQNPGYN